MHIAQCINLPQSQVSSIDIAGNPLTVEKIVKIMLNHTVGQNIFIKTILINENRMKIQFLNLFLFFLLIKQHNRNPPFVWWIWDWLTYLYEHRFSVNTSKNCLMPQLYT